MTKHVDELSQFKGTSIDSIKGVANEKGERLKGKSGSRFYQLPDGKSTVRFLANPLGGSFFLEATYHWINGEKVHCRRPLNEKCPVCNLASSIWTQSEEAKEEGRIEDAKNFAKQAKDLFAKNEYYYNVVVRTKDEGDKVVVLSTGVTVKKEVTKLFFNEDFGDVTDPVEGHDIVIEKSGKGKETRYSTTPRPKKSLLAGSTDDKAEAAKLIKAIYEQRKNLSEFVSHYSIDKLDEIVSNYKSNFEEGGDAGASDDSDDREAPSASAEIDPQYKKIDDALEKVVAGRK